MSKKVIKDADGNTYVKKKKFGCLGIIAVIVVIGIIVAVAGGNKKDDVKKVSDKTEQTTKKEETKTEFKVGETASYKGYEIKVNKVDFSDGSEYNKPDAGKQFVIVNITITNNTDKTQSYNPFDFKLNSNGNATDVNLDYVENVDNLNSGELDPKATVTGNLVGQASPDGALKLDYHSNIFSDKTIEFVLR